MTREYYNDGVTYDRNIAAEHREEALGWQPISGRAASTRRRGSSC